jgi:hypothetical protein
MTNNSYYDDIALIDETLKRVEGDKESTEVILESFNYLTTIHEEFSTIAASTSPTDKTFQEAYKKLTNSYIAFESMASYVDSKCKIISAERSKIIRISYLLLDERSTLIKSRLFVEDGNIPAHFLEDIRRLWKESSTIGFYLDINDKSILSDIEEYINSL